ncbi:MAG: RDD family protein [Acidobacteria bacterium]|nr:RDD family protein [Acidobacteriota bacterium]
MFCIQCGFSNAAEARFCASCGATLTPAESSGTAAAPAETPVAAAAIARLGDRFLAVLLDAFLWAGVFALTGMWSARRWGGLTESGFSLAGTAAWVAITATLLAGLLYYWVCEGLFGVTLGKALIGIAVRRTDGTACTMSSSLIRNLLRLVDGIGGYLVGLVAALLSRSRQRLGDHAARTIVVERPVGAVVRALLVALWLAIVAGSLTGAYLLHRGAGPSVAESGDLKLVNVDFLQSEDGPSRPAAPYKPGEKVYMKYDVVGFGHGGDGRIELALSAVALDPDGRALHTPWSKDLSQTIARGRPVNGSFSVGLPLFAPAGQYRIDLRVEDKVKNLRLQYAPAFQVESAASPPAAVLEIRDFEMSLAQNGPPVAAPVLEGGGTVYMRWKVAGIKFEDDKMDVRVALQVLDSAGKLVLERPDYVTVSDTSVYHPPSFFVPMSGHVSVPSGMTKGTYTAKYQVTDNFARSTLDNTARFEVR